jgi:hypothetical protein
MKRASTKHQRRSGGEANTSLSWTPEEREAYLKKRKSSHAEPTSHKAECVHCGRQFGINEGYIGPHGSLCDTCTG